MNAIEPPVIPPRAARIIFAKDQPEYDPLPAAVTPEGAVMTEWEFTAEELASIVNGGRLRLWIHTFNRPLQPVALEVIEGE